VPGARAFHRAFRVGERGRIRPVDALGVALSAVQGLQKELARLDRSIAALRRRVERLTP
jgi:hypothetical protein